MTVAMAEKDPPVFRDFLGIGRKDEPSSAKQQQPQQPSSGSGKRTDAVVEDDGDAEASTKSLPRNNTGHLDGHSTPGLLTPPFGSAFPSSSEQGSDGWLRARAGSVHHHGVKSALYKPETDNRAGVKKRESPVGRESLQERLQMSVEALENSRPSKVTRVEQKDDKKAKSRSSAGFAMDELRLSMQPPRPSSKGVVMYGGNATKPELSARISSKQDRSRAPMNAGVSTPLRVSHLGQSSEKPPGQIPMEGNLSIDNIGLPPIPALPAADEGSRTGIKGSGLIAGLQQNAAAAAPSTQIPGMSGSLGPTPRRPKVSTHSGGSDPILASRHQFPTPPSRSLTIFYGGQAHVFDDVPPEKANRIMQLAGSNGRSWSTAYSPRQTPSIANTTSDGSLSALEREREREREKLYGMSRGGPAGGGNLALSPEVKTLLRGLPQSGGGGRSGQPPPSSDALAGPVSMDNQVTAAERSAANGNRKESIEKRAVPRPSPLAEDNPNDPLVRGQHWM